MEHSVKIDDFSKDQWEHWAGEFADRSIYQTWAYQEYRAHRDRQDLSRAVVFNQDARAVLMCQVRIRRLGALPYSVGYVQWGPLMRRRDQNGLAPAGAFDALRQAYVGPRVSVLRLVPNVLEDADGRIVVEALGQAGFQRARKVPPYRTHILDVSVGPEQIRSGLRKSFRRDLRKAEHEGLEVCVGSEPLWFEELDKLYGDLRKRKGFRGVDLGEFAVPQKALSQDDKMTLVLVRQAGKPVTVVLVSFMGDTGIALIAATSEEGRQCFSSFLAWYHVAVSAHEAGLRWLDLGGIDPEDNPTVTQFKSRMGGTEACHIGAFDACRGQASRIGWQCLDTIYQKLRR